MDEREAKTPIPAAVLAVLKHKWIVQAGDTAHQAVFESRGEQRQCDPSIYHYTAARTTRTPNRYTYSEIKALCDASVFGSLSNASRDGRVAVNEHMQHALEDFCRETYEAWARFEGRRQDILRMSRRPSQFGARP